MARRVQFSIGQPLTITEFLMAVILLVVDLVAIMASLTYDLIGKTAPSESHALTEAFYYAIFAAIIYILIGRLICITVYGAIKGHYE